MAVRLWALAVPAACILAACASIDEESCRVGDWETIGFRDGEAGRTPGTFFDHAKACNKIGVAPVKSVWERGYQEGLTRYCTPRRAFREGQNGDRLRNVCPIEIAPELRATNERGLRLHRIDRDIEDNEHRIRAINSMLFDLADGDPARTQLVSERSILRLENLRLRSRRAAITF